MNLYVQSSSGETICPACQRYVVKSDEEVGFACERDQELGRRLANAKYLAFYRGEKGFVLIPGYSMKIYQLVDEIQDHPDWIFKLNDSDLTELYHLPASCIFIANYVPLNVEIVFMKIKILLLLYLLMI